MHIARFIVDLEPSLNKLLEVKWNNNITFLLFEIFFCSLLWFTLYNKDALYICRLSFIYSCSRWASSLRIWSWFWTLETKALYSRQKNNELLSLSWEFALIMVFLCLKIIAISNAVNRCWIFEILSICPLLKACILEMIIIEPSRPLMVEALATTQTQILFGVCSIWPIFLFRSLLRRFPQVPLHSNSSIYVQIGSQLIVGPSLRYPLEL